MVFPQLTSTVKIPISLGTLARDSLGHPWLSMIMDIRYFLRKSMEYPQITLHHDTYYTKRNKYGIFHIWNIFIFGIYFRKQILNNILKKNLYFMMCIIRIMTIYNKKHQQNIPNQLLLICIFYFFLAQCKFMHISNNNQKISLFVNYFLQKY